MVRWPPIHCDEGRRPISRSVPGPRRCTASRPSSFSAALARSIWSIRSPQAATGSGSSTRQMCTTCSHSRASAASGVEIGMDERSPSRRRARDRRPVEPCRGHVLERLAAPGREIAPDPVGIRPVEQSGRDRARQADRGAAVLAELADHLHDPPRLVSQRLVDRVVEAGALHPGVAVGDVHEHRSGPVAAGGDRAGKLLLPDRRADVHPLPGLDVRAEVDDEVGHLLERAGVHGATVPHAAILPTCPLHAERGI